MVARAGYEVRVGGVPSLPHWVPCKINGGSWGGAEGNQGKEGWLRMQCLVGWGEEGWLL